MHHAPQMSAGCRMNMHVARMVAAHRQLPESLAKNAALATSQFADPRQFPRGDMFGNTLERRQVLTHEVAKTRW